MKTLTLLLILSLADTARVLMVKQESKANKDSCKCYLAKDPKSSQLNPYGFADSAQVKKAAKAVKKKRP